MSNDTLSKSNSDELYIGKGRDNALENQLGRRGAPFSPKVLVSLGAPAVADADYLIKAATGTEIPDAAETVTYDAADDEDASPVDAAATATQIYPFGATTQEDVWGVSDGAEFGRNLAVVVTHASAVVACTVLVSGYDYLGRAMSELFTITAGGTSKTATGNKAFAYVSTVAITAEGAMTGCTMNVGTGSKLGLPYKLAKVGYLTNASLNGVQELINVASNATVVAAVTTSPATTSTGDVRGTITFNGTLNGTSEAMVEMYVADRNTRTGLVGVTQA